MIDGEGLRRVSGAGWLTAVIAAAVLCLGLAAPASASALLDVGGADGGGESAFATSELTGASGIVTNASFESGVSGWNVSGSSPGVSLSQVPGGHSGDWAARLSHDGAAATCMLNDAPNWVTTTAAGKYTASLWVRADAPGATLKLKLREYNQQYGWLANVASSEIVLTTSWQQVSLRLTPADPGTTTLDLTAYISDAAAGSCFYADDAAIDFAPAPAASLSVTPTTGVPPVSVRADASASTVTDRPIASYTFNFDDGSAPVGPQASATADHTYIAGGPHRVTVTVTDTDGQSSTTTSVILLAPNEIANSTFEQYIGCCPSTIASGQGWNTASSGPAVTLTQVPAAHSG